MADKRSCYVSSVRSSEALQLYNEAVELFVNHKGSFIELVKRAIEAENDFILARCLLVRIHVYVHR